LKASLVLLASKFAFADGNLQKVNHIIIVMPEKYSFDNYFGALAYALGSLYLNGNGACLNMGHTCVDGLTGTVTGGVFSCTNSNVDENGNTIFAFKATTCCVVPVTPFSKLSHVSHTSGDHTSILAMIEKRSSPACT